MGRRDDALVDALKEIRCGHCNRLLCKASPQPVREGQTIEIKCWKCDALNYLKGRPTP
jgi:phage FluMu protein Com